MQVARYFRWGRWAPMLLAAVVAACGGDGGGGDTPTPVPEGQITLLAHSDSRGSADGKGLSARFSSPHDVVQAPNGTIYIADSLNNTIRKIAPDGTVSTLAGAANKMGEVDGTGDQARFFQPRGIAIDSQGNLYVTEERAVRRITPAGAVTTIASDLGRLEAVPGSRFPARYLSLGKVAIDSKGNLFVVVGPAIRRVSPDGTVATWLGSMVDWRFAVGDGTNARFNGVAGIATDAADNIYVSDTVAGTSGGTFRRFDKDGRALPWGNAPQGVLQAPIVGAIAVNASGQVAVASGSSIYRITPEGSVVPVAGSQFGNDDGTGAQAQFAAPSGLAVDAQGTLLVVDAVNHNIRRVSSQGVVSTLAGDPTPTAKRIWGLGGITATSDGTLYLAETYSGSFRKVSQSGEMSTIAKQGEQVRRFFAATAIAGSATLVVSYGDGPFGPRQGVVAVVEPGGMLRELDRRPSDNTPSIAGHPDGRIFVAFDSAVEVFHPGGRKQLLVSGVSAQGLAVALDGTLFITERTRVRAIDPLGNIRLIAGSGEVGNLDAVGAAARFEVARAITLDPVGNLYVVDLFKIRKISPDGTVRTIAGTHHGAETAPGPLPGSIGGVQGLVWSSGAIYANVESAILRIGPLP